MPIPENCVRVSVNWSMPLGEIAVNTLNFHHEHPAGELDWEGDMTQRYADLVRDGLVAGWATGQNLFTSTVALRDVTAYHLDTNGHTLHKKTALPPAGGLKGSAASNPLPMEVATVVSLYGYPVGEYVPDGARKRGRIYLPPMAASVLDGVGFNDRVAQTITFMQTWLSYCQGRVMDGSDVGNVPGERERARLVVLSRKYGEFAAVEQIRVDNIFDVQRRRQNAYPVAATAVALERQDD